MIWSLVKIVAFICVVALLAFGGSLLMELDGVSRFQYGSFEINLSPLHTVIALVVLVAVAFVVFKLVGLLIAFVKFLLGDETAISRYFDRNREKRGYEALSEGLLALASGEGRLALTKAGKAERFLQRPELTNILKAQAATMVGDKRTAERAYRKLVSIEKTRFVGVQGIMRQKLEAGDTDTALKLAEKAFAIKPQHHETQDVLLKLQAQKGDWGAARGTLAAKLKHGAIPRDVHKRRDAVLALSEAKDLVDGDGPVEKRLAAIEANKKSPDLIPAAIMASDSYVEEGKPKLAAKIIKKAWEAQPHPELAAAFARIAPEETPQQRLKRFAALSKAKPSDPETKMLFAELNIAAEDFPSARRALGDLAETKPTARVLTILAAIERGEGAEDVVVRSWLTSALTAPRGPQWVCENCQTVHAEWAPVCEACDAFDSLSWKEPKNSEVAMPAGTEMLPMIVGEDHTEAADLVEVSDDEVVDIDPSTVRSEVESDSSKLH